ncbi:MAG: glutathione S-transferase N-terminal domain-containing protein [Nitrosospira sp.]|nr:glutathione S-transferase N-terminal domain-containing protein [Nitrosospira sp.]MBI0416927.1 glutathione S-transferase N-terminal domain-containing protein [Nitrosospira sp.]MBI0418039.1 glutathione S-transferase N-terminal domain-containing protein [Nitrosospira sp.]MBI0419697.1 glutathione S-transferase N-terminal domain-containing protein [Nitrosospira sp.]
MRARMAMIDSGINFNVYEVSLKNKPHEMIAISPKGTVPVLRLDNQVIDESIDIMMWAYSNGDSLQHLNSNKYLIRTGMDLIYRNDNEFKLYLDQYKYFTNYPLKTKNELGNACLFFIKILEDMLSLNQYLLSGRVSFADIAIFPFIRQFANVDMNFFSNLKFSRIQEWLLDLTGSELFINAMIRPR